MTHLQHWTSHEYWDWHQHVRVVEDVNECRRKREDWLKQLEAQPHLHLLRSQLESLIDIVNLQQEPTRQEQRACTTSARIPCSSS